MADGVKMILDELSPPVVGYEEISLKNNGCRHMCVVIEGGPKRAAEVGSFLSKMGWLKLIGFGFPDTLPRSIGKIPTERIDPNMIYELTFPS